MPVHCQSPQCQQKTHSGNKHQIQHFYPDIKSINQLIVIEGKPASIDNETLPENAIERSKEKRSTKSISKNSKTYSNSHKEIMVN